MGAGEAVAVHADVRRAGQFDIDAEAGHRNGIASDLDPLVLAELRASNTEVRREERRDGVLACRDRVRQ